MMNIADLMSLKVTVISPVSVGYNLEVTFHFSYVKNLVRRREGGRKEQWLRGATEGGWGGRDGNQEYSVT